MSPGFGLPVGRPAVMGVLNVTPDSFSDGGQFFEPEAGVARALEMMAEGADLIDVGGESTRPGAEHVPADEECARVLPVIEALVAEGVPVSVDTSKGMVARLAVAAGASVLNDVTALSDPESLAVAVESGVTVCLMHMQGEPRTMQGAPEYADVVEEVFDFLMGRVGALDAAGHAGEVWIDPGIGFGKSLDHNLLLLRHLDRFVATGAPVLLGVSRKSFLGRLLDGAPTGDRLDGSLAVQTLAQAAGVRVLRTHDVRATVRAVRVAQAVLEAGTAPGS